MDEQPSLPVAAALPDRARRARITTRLGRIGAGPQANYVTLCGLLDMQPLPSHSMLISHMIRELESALRDVLLPGDLPETDEPLCCACPNATVVDAARKGNSVHRAEIEAIADALGLPLDGPVIEAWTFIVGKQHGWTHRSNLEMPDPVDEDVLARIDRLEMVFDAVLDRFYGAGYLEMIGRLEALADKENPTKDDAGRLRQYFPQDPLTLEVFFDRLTGPQWLLPLNSKKFFATPPKAIVGEDGWVRTPVWPASRYLARVAGQDPVNATEIARIMPATDNPLVNLDLVQVALAVPPEKAARLVPRLAAAVTANVAGADQYARLAVVLAEGGRHQEAAVLLRAVYAMNPDAEFAWVAPRISDFEFTDTLARYRDRLSKALGLTALSLFVELLVAAVDLAPPKSALLGDGSRLWLPAVERPDLGSPMTDGRAGLAYAVRDIATDLIENGHGVAEITALLPLDGPSILARLHLHVLREHGDAAPELVRKVLTDHALIGREMIEHEWLLLAVAHAELLTETARAALVAAIDAGPDVGLWQQAQTAGGGQELPAATVAVRADLWRRDRYGAIKAILAEPANSVFSQLAETYGAPRFERGASDRFTVVDLPASPVSADDLSSADTAQQLVEAVQAFTPEEGMFGHSNLYSFGAQLRKAVTARADVYSADAPAFAVLEDPYPTWVVGGFLDALGRSDALDWPKLLELLDGIVVSPEHRQARREAVNLLHTALSNDVMPQASGDAAWQIIDGVLGAAPENVEATVTAQAMRAAAAWAIWRHREGADATAAITALTGVDVSVDAEIATALGECFVRLAFLDQDAAAGVVDVLQPGGPGFDGYLRSDFRPKSVELMMPAYRRAVEPDVQVANHAQLGVHVLSLYWCDQTDLLADSIIDLYYRHPATTTRVREDLARTLAFGSALESGPAAEHYNAFFDWRLAALTPLLTENPNADERRELLMMSGTLLRTAVPVQALTTLRQVLDATGELGNDPRLFRDLQAMMGNEPAAVLDLILAWVSVLSPTDWTPHGRQGEISAILRTALDTGDQGLREKVDEIINRAASAGHYQFRELAA